MAVLLTLVAFTLALVVTYAVPDAYACDPELGCTGGGQVSWPDPPAYKTVLTRAPANWITNGHYVAGDVVWRRTQLVGYTQVTDRWYVYEYDDSGRLTAPSCCSDGPYYVSSSGTLFIP
jgi:hypothetical protein